jgi:DNA invertase Pin-like site-specific DNA recombinase
VVLVESAGRFARDLVVQLTGHALMMARGIELVPADAPTYFTDPSPTAVMVRQILGAVSEFEKAGLVAKLRAARERKRQITGRCEGRPPVPPAVVAAARRLARRSPKTGKRRSLRAISEELAVIGYLGVSGGPYTASSVRHMLAPRA